ALLSIRTQDPGRLDLKSQRLCSSSGVFTVDRDVTAECRIHCTDEEAGERTLFNMDPGEVLGEIEHLPRGVIDEPDLALLVYCNHLLCHRCEDRLEDLICRAIAIAAPRECKMTGGEKDPGAYDGAQYECRNC